MNQDNTQEVYNRLSAPNDTKNQKWTLYLVACCMVASLASFTFGYNIGVINLPTPLVSAFYSERYFSEYLVGLQRINEADQRLTNASLLVDAAIERYANNTKKTFAEAKETLTGYANATDSSKIPASLKPLVDNIANITGSREAFRKKKGDLDEAGTKVKRLQNILWTTTTSIFVVGGTIGALTSKNVCERFGRKNGIIFHYIFAIVGAILSIIAPYINSPECVIIGRFLFGIQGGMACGLIPTYLYEISPSKLRGSTGVIHQLFLTIGIAASQLLGFRQVLGVSQFWHILLGLPLVPCALGGVLLFIFFPETPTALIRKHKNDKAASQALKKLRNTGNVESEIEEIRLEISKESASSKSLSIPQLFKRPEFKWPLITGLVLQLVQQLCGINAIFFYSERIYREAGISPDNIQYAVGLTGVINVIMTLIAVSLIDKLGRKPLLLYPMILIVIDFIILTILLFFKSQYQVLSYVSIVCIILFIMCFAVGLGPIPFIYVAEAFPSEARATAIAVCMFTNWMANLLLTMTFTYIADLLKDFTFLVFTVIVALAVAFIWKKLPETKNRTPDQILAKLDPKYANRFEESSGKLIGNTSV